MICKNWFLTVWETLLFLSEGKVRKILRLRSVSAAIINDIIDNNT